MQKFVYSALAGLLLSRYANGQGDCDPETQDCISMPILALSPDNTCSGDTWLIPDPVGWAGVCTKYSTSDFPQFPSDSNGQMTAWISGKDIYEPTCKFLIYTVPTGDPTCGQLVASVEPDTPCREYTFPANFGAGWCCNVDGVDTCQYREPDKRSVGQRSHPRDLMPRAPTAPNRAAAPELPKQKRQDSCNYVQTAGPEKIDGDAQRVSSALNCPATGDSCAITDSWSLTTGSTNTFGVSTEVGASFFEVISASVSFSYEYSYSEEETIQQDYTVNLAAGQSGYLSWTPEVECKFRKPSLREMSSGIAWITDSSITQY